MKEKKQINFGLAILPIVVVIAMGLSSVMVWKAGMFIPLIGSIATAALVSKYLGYSWDEIQKSLVNGVARALPALFILMIVGAIVGSWIQSGVIPTMIYYALKFISPSIFVPAACLVTAVIASATGTSFASIATIGLALMATGLGMGFPAPLLAGAIISGAFFGDSVSPLSDSTNLSSAMTDTNLFEMIGHQLKTSIPALLIASVCYYFVAIPYVGSANAESALVTELITGISEAFVISPLLLLIPVITVVLSIKKVPALPSLILVAVLGAICAVIVQGADVTSAIKTMTSGYVSKTGLEMVDKLLSSGGITSMANTVMLMTIATALGGTLESIGFLQEIVRVIVKPIKSTGGLVLVTVLSGFMVAFATGAQLLAIVLPARMFPEEYRKRNLHPKNLARTAASIGAVCITLVPWSVPATYASNMFNVQPAAFIPYLYFPMAIAVINILYGFLGFTMTKLDPSNNATEEIVD